MQSSGGMSRQQQQNNLVATNRMARQAILQRALEMTQLVYSQSIAAPGPGNNIITVPPRPVGLIKGFWVELTGTVNSGALTLDPTTLNVSNFLSNVTFYDLNNNLRINTPGWHLHLLNSVKARRPFVSAYTTDNPCGFGSNMGANNWIFSPGPLVATTGTIRMLYWVPLAYSDRDLRGAIYGNVVSATMQLILTINPNPFALSTGDPTFAIFQSTTASITGATLTNVTVNVYQVYFDQLPQIQNQGPFLPILDLSTIYELKTTSLTGMVTNQDFPIPYSNYREFISTMLMYDNSTGGSLLNPGTDINYLALQSANFTNIYKTDPYLVSMITRQDVMDDFPVGIYYISTRKKPLSTVQYGNLEAILNPLGTVNAGAQVLAAYEDFAIVNTVTGAGSLPAG
jgi:hypothetical protein